MRPLSQAHPRARARLIISVLLGLVVVLSNVSAPQAQLLEPLESLRAVLGQLYPAAAVFIGDFIRKEIIDCLEKKTCREALSADVVIQRVKAYYQRVFGGSPVKPAPEFDLSADQKAKVASLLRDTKQLYVKLHPNDAKSTEYYQEIRFDSLKELGGQGFRVITSSDERVKEIIHTALTEKTGVIVGFVGDFDVGKTYMASQICERPHAQGFGIATHALAVMAPDLDFPAILLDSAGAQRACPSYRLTDRTITDHFIQDMIVELSDVIIFVVSSLRTRDQVRIQELLQRIQHSKKDLIIVHNYPHLISESDVQNYIQRDILEAFNGTYQHFSKLGFGYWQSLDVETSRLVRHVVMANDQHIGKEKYNDDAKKALMMWMAAAKASVERSDLDVVSAVVNHLNVALPRIFFSETPRAGSRPNWFQPGVGLVQRFADFTIGAAFSGVKRVYRYLAGSDSESKSGQAPQPTSPLEVSVYDDEVPNSTDRYIRLVKPQRLVYLPSNSIAEMPDAFGSLPIDISISTQNKEWLVWIEAPGLEPPSSGGWKSTFLAGTRTVIIRGNKKVHPAYSERKPNCTSPQSGSESDPVESANSKAADPTSRETFDVSASGHASTKSTFSPLASWDSDGPKKRLGLLNDPCYAYQFAQQQRKFAPFITTFDLPNAVDQNSIEITYVNGVIEIRGKFSRFDHEESAIY